MVVWAKTKKIRNPQTGRRIQRRRPEAEWVRVEMPEQRIVPESLWRAVQERLAFVNRVYGAQGRKGGLMNSRAASSPYIFSGLLKCDVCGANFTIVSGKGKHHATADYGCPAFAFRGTCKNARRISRETVETQLLAKLQRDVLSDAAIDYVLERLEQEIEKRFATLGGEVEEMRKRKAVLETEISNLSRAIASGPDDVPSLRAAIVERESEIARITAKTLGHKKGSIHQQVAGLRKFVKESLRDVRALLTSKHANPAAIRQELSAHIDAITLLPDGKGDSVRYRGKWAILGSGYREYAEGQNRTAYAGLFRAALYR
jgi:site-specific DNA recombinase